MVEHQKSDLELVLELAVKEINDTAGPDGFVTSTLVFGEIPRMEITSDFGRSPNTFDRG